MRELNLDEVKEIQLNILKTVSEYCENNQLKYFLGYGTLLGAVRHEGYIPWDDDIDIMMPRDDYEIFIKSFKIDNYDVKSHYKDEKYPYPFAKVSYEKTKLIENTDLKYDLGVNIDIFPLDIFVEDEKSFNKIYQKIKWNKRILNVKKISISKDRKFYKNLILKIGKFLFQFIEYNVLIKKINNMAMSQRNMDSASLMGCAVDSYGKKDMMDRHVFKESIYLNFEQYKFPVPKEYDAYLENIYGDYMKLPPVQDRKTHHDYKAFFLDC